VAYKTQAELRINAHDSLSRCTISPVGEGASPPEGLGFRVQT
jgi:hypothetical protein